MGIFFSTQAKDNDAVRQKQDQESRLVPRSLDLLALEAYDNYVKSLSSLSLYTSKFTFSHHDAYGLTKDEFKEVMDEYKIPKAKRSGDMAKSIVVMYEEEGRVHKCILIFARSKPKKADVYDVLVAEATMSSNFNRVRAGCAICSSIVVSGALCLLNPTAGIVTGVVCTLMTSGKVVYDKNHHNFEDVTIGYMIRQLIDARNLKVTTGGKLAFVHRGQVTVLDNDSKPTVVNEDSSEDSDEVSDPRALENLSIQPPADFGIGNL